MLRAREPSELTPDSLILMMNVYCEKLFAGLYVLIFLVFHLVCHTKFYHLCSWTTGYFLTLQEVESRFLWKKIFETQHESGGAKFVCRPFQMRP